MNRKKVEEDEEEKEKEEEEKKEKTNTALFFTFWKKALLWLIYMYIQHACAQLTTQIHRPNNMCLNDKFTNSNVDHASL